MGENVLISGRTFKDYCEFLELDTKLIRKNNSFLDVGGGFSGFTGKLLEKGKHAYSLDIGYSNLEEMMVKYVSQEIGTIHSKIEDFQKILEIDIHENRKKKIREFIKVYEKNPKNFISGSCFEIPFKNDFFDLSVCVALIGNHRYFRAYDFLRGIEEMARVSRQSRIYSAFFNKWIFESPDYSKILLRFNLCEKRANKNLLILEKK